MRSYKKLSVVLGQRNLLGQFASAGPFGMALVLVVAARILGFPEGTIDDWAYLGPGMYLGSGEGFINPHYCQGLIREGEPPYYFPPHYSWLVASWVAIFGKSKASMDWFIALGGAIFVVASIAFCQANLKAGRLQGYIVSAVFSLIYVLQFQFGARPEIWGSAFMMLGCSMVRRNPVPLTFSFFFAALSSAVAPRLHVYPILFLLGALGICKVFETGSLWKIGKLIAIAMAAHAILFSLLIRCDFEEFFQIYFEYTERASGVGGISNPLSVVSSMWARLHPAAGIGFLFSIVSMIMVVPFRRGRLFAPVVVCVLILGFGFRLNAGDGRGVLGVVWGISIFGWMAICDNRLSGIRAAFLLVSGVAISMQCATQLVALSSSGLGFRNREGEMEEHFAEVREFVRGANPDRVLVHSKAAALIYDYNVPKGWRDWLAKYSVPNNMPGGIGDSEENEIWILPYSEEGFGLQAAFPYDVPPAKRVSFLGKEFGNVSENPFHCVVIRGGEIIFPKTAR